MMNKSVHENNAFHYGCWGANPIAATTSEMQRNKRGFSVSGADGKLHNLPVSYYTVNVTIPAVVPDGVYALGWVWYGGMGGSIYNNVPEKPYPRGLFADYWSCAFVGVRGGSEMTENFQPAFRSDMERWWGDACMSANDAPGGCTYEPCIVRGKMQKPRPFQAGRRPGSITPADFEDTRTRGSGRRVPPVVSERIILRDALTALYEWKARAMRTSDERQLEG